MTGGAVAANTSLGDRPAGWTLRTAPARVVQALGHVVYGLEQVASRSDRRKEPIAHKPSTQLIDQISVKLVEHELTPDQRVPGPVRRAQ